MLKNIVASIIMKPMSTTFSIIYQFNIFLDVYPFFFFPFLDRIPLFSTEYSTT